MAEFVAPAPVVLGGFRFSSFAGVPSLGGCEQVLDRFHFGHLKSQLQRMPENRSPRACLVREFRENAGKIEGGRLY